MTDVANLMFFVSFLGLRIRYWLIIIVVVVVVLALLYWASTRNRRS